MKNLKMIENELVPVYETSTGEKVVYGTELHAVLEVKTAYKDWSVRRFNECDAVKNEDYEVLLKNERKPKGGRPSLEHIIKLDVAKEMAMLERNNKGKQVRRYFIEIEKKYKEIKEELKSAFMVHETENMNVSEIRLGELARYLAIMDKVAHRQNLAPHKIAENFKKVSEQFGIQLTEDFVNLPEYEQLTLFDVEIARFQKEERKRNYEWINSHR